MISFLASELLHLPPLLSHLRDRRSLPFVHVFSGKLYLVVISEMLKHVKYWLSALAPGMQIDRSFALWLLWRLSGIWHGGFCNLVPLHILDFLLLESTPRFLLAAMILVEKSHGRIH